MVTSTFLAFLGMLITSGSCLKSPVDSAADTGNPNQNFSPSTSSLENLVDGKCKQYTADLQDQVNELRAKVDRLEVTKDDGRNLRNCDHSFAKGIKKRDIPKSLRAMCSTSSSLCTYYYPDHPDASRKKGKYSPTVTTEMLQNDPSVTLIGIPTNCNDLQQLGHSLNGLYLIKKSLPNDKGTKIQTVFCDFLSSHPSNVFNAEEFVGTVDVKTKSVHFSVQRNSSFNRFAVIPFDVAPINEGNAFHLSSGIFTVPVPGIYHFDFSALKSSSANFLDIFLQVNGKTIGTAFTDIVPNSSKSPSSNVVSLSASLRLAAGDKVNLLNNKGFNAIGELFDSGNHHTSFTGWLVEEDLV